MLTNSTFSAPSSSAAPRALASISRVISIPITWPSRPTIWAATSVSVPRAAAQVEDALTGLETSELPRVRDPGERLDCRLRHRGELGWVAEVLGPGAAGGEDEVGVGLLGDAGVRLLDLALQQLDIDPCVNWHQLVPSVPGSYLLANLAQAQAPAYARSA
jgi:hypothetical protein